MKTGRGRAQKAQKGAMKIFFVLFVPFVALLFLYRFDLYVTEFHDTRAVLQADRTSRVSRVLDINGFCSVQYDDQVRTLRRNLESIPFAAGLHRCQRLRDINNRAGRVCLIWTLIVDVDFVGIHGRNLLRIFATQKTPLLASSSAQNSTQIESLRRSRSPVAVAFVRLVRPSISRQFASPMVLNAARLLPSKSVVPACRRVGLTGRITAGNPIESE
jgi:hypothetical protein